MTKPLSELIEGVRDVRPVLDSIEYSTAERERGIVIGHKAACDVLIPAIQECLKTLEWLSYHAELGPCEREMIAQNEVEIRALLEGKKS